MASLYSEFAAASRLLGETMTDSFKKYFAHASAASFSASGRVNLIGEHTDYNEGFVLPLALPQMTHVAISLRHDQQVRVVSRNMATDAPIESYALGDEKRQGRWLDYVQGVTWFLRANSYPLKGFEAVIDSQLPIGSGLSSSAALLVCLFRALRSQLALPLDDVEIAEASRTVENEFVGARVGIMDPMASSLAGQATALFLDTRDLSYRQIPLPKERMEIFVIDSGIKHSHAQGAYNIRRSECEEAARLLGVRALRDCSEADLPRLKDLPDIIGRRARHIITENKRVLESVEALREKDVVRFGRLMVESHHSMRDDFEISTPDIDSLVATALNQQGVYGARMTGGGFGGSIVGVAEVGRGRRIADSVCRRFEGMSKHRPTVLVPVE